jgi:hypothetical protein
MIVAYNQMPITTYGKILDIIQDDSRDTIDKEVAMISILANKTPEEIENMPIVELRTLTSQLGFLTEKAEAVEVRKEYKVGDYILIPEKKISKIKAGQFISFQEFAKVYRDNNNDVNVIPLLLSCFLIPKGKTFAEGYDVEDVQEAIAEHLSVVDALALTAFFLTSIKQSQATILHYLEWRLRLSRAKTKEQKMAKKMQIARLQALRRSVLNGVGR